METNRNYLMVGAFVLVGVIGTVLFAVWITKSADDRQFYPYVIRFAESVHGISNGTMVKYRGVEVGKIEKISIDAENTNLIRVDVKIDRNAPVKTDTVASLKMQGITGTSYIELSGGSPELPPLYNEDTAGIPEIPSKASDLNAIVNRMPELLDKTSQVADQAVKMISDQNVEALTKTLQNLSELTASINAQTEQVAQLISRSNQVANDLHDITSSSKQDIRELTASLKESSRHFNQFIDTTNNASQASYQEVYQLLVELKKTARDIRSLTSNLDRNPSRILVPQEEKGIPAP